MTWPSRSSPGSGAGGPVTGPPSAGGVERVTRCSPLPREEFTAAQDFLRERARPYGISRAGIPRAYPVSYTPPVSSTCSESLLSDQGVPLEEISRLVGHSGTAVTEEVYREQIRPVIQTGAVVMDGSFKRSPKRGSRRWTRTRNR
ncbi:hypothetical protein GCM10023335_01660 [Streptomyces siamensis]|uniref:Tyr recombinase domain-containing protein n=1 Tax=Streptomyces siamensis TaxID=1274986 RepID=A0ABP9IB82_9ACTN